VPEPVIRVRGLAKSYPVALGFRRRPALRDVDLDVGAGEVVALLGPNGSGKSTLLRAIAGLERCDRGERSIRGAPAGSREACRRLGYCPEDAPFPHYLPARSCLVDLASLGGLRGADLASRVDSALERFGLAAEAKTPAGRLSRGQGRRLAIAQAVLHEPDALLLDEPTSGLDALGTLVLEEVIREARDRGAAVLMSSHLGSDVDRSCSRVVVLREGRKETDGPVDAVLGLSDRREIVVDGLGPDAWRSLDLTVGALGGRIVEARTGKRSLAEIFRAFLAK